MIEGTYPPDNPSELRFSSETKMSRAAFDVVRGLIQVNPQHRWSLDRCLKDPWLITDTGPLGKTVWKCEDCQRRRAEGQERRALLPRDPPDFQQLHRELQVLIQRFKMFIGLRKREV